jgi:hypothetical protein
MKDAVLPQYISWRTLTASSSIVAKMINLVLIHVYKILKRTFLPFFQKELLEMTQKERCNFYRFSTRIVDHTKEVFIDLIDLSLVHKYLSFEDRLVEAYNTR